MEGESLNQFLSSMNADDLESFIGWLVSSNVMNKLDIFTKDCIMRRVRDVMNKGANQ